MAERKPKKGTTLVELIIVVIIIGALSILAITQYNAFKENALDKEAISNLKLIAAAEKIRHSEQGSYMHAQETADVNTILKLRLPTTGTPWYYSVSGGFDIFCAEAVKVNPDKAWIIQQDMEEPIEGRCGA